jgi:hypothetical protein
VPQSHAEAARWYFRAAEQGQAEAQNELGAMYYDGNGMPQNRAQAARWFRLAADQDVVHAQFSLGWMYYDGKGGLRITPRRRAGFAAPPSKGTRWRKALSA